MLSISQFWPWNLEFAILDYRYSSVLKLWSCHMYIYLYIMDNFSCFFLSSADFIQNQHFPKILSGIPSECQIVWNQIRPDFMSGLIWVQTVCKSYQQMTLGDKESLKESQTADSKGTDCQSAQFDLCPC